MASTHCHIPSYISWAFTFTDKHFYSVGDNKRCSNDTHAPKVYLVTGLLYSLKTQQHSIKSKSCAINSLFSLFSLFSAWKFLLFNYLLLKFVLTHLNELFKCDVPGFFFFFFIWKDKDYIVLFNSLLIKKNTNSFIIFSLKLRVLDAFILLLTTILQVFLYSIIN